MDLVLRRSLLISYVTFYYHSHDTIDRVLDNEKAGALYLSCLLSSLRNNFSSLYYDTEVSRSPGYSASSSLWIRALVLREDVYGTGLSVSGSICGGYSMLLISYCALADASVTNSLFSLLITDFQMQPLVNDESLFL